MSEIIFGKSLMNEVTNDVLELVNDRIKTVSDQLKALNFENLLPVDLIETKGVSLRKVVSAKEESFCTLGSPWKEGTVGGIVLYGKRYIGITS
jgi:hypothetical protein